MTMRKGSPPVCISTVVIWVQWDGGCQIYEQRPNPCRMYSCEHDDRIWKDFDAMELNDEWIAEYLVKQRGPVELFMDAVRSS